MGSNLLKDWDYRKNWVGHDSAHDFIGKYINAETSIVCVGQPVFSDNTEIDSIKTVGLTQQFGMREGKQVGRVFEIGSRGNVLIPGRGAGSLALGRIIFSGPSLLKALYPDVTDEQARAYFRKPGYGQAFFNLQSELFNEPCGLFFLMFNQLNELYAGIFFEVCQISGHAFNMTANANMAAENATLMYQEIYQVDPGQIIA